MPTIDFLWDEWSDNVLQETDENNVVTTYFQRPEKYGEVLYHKAGSRFSFYHFDGNGSTRKLTNVSQSTIKTFIFSGFGELVASSGTGSTPFVYKGAAGYYTNPVTNDIYVRARTYAPTTGRWLSKDPLGFVDGPNLYGAYFVPAGFDPSGTRKVCCQYSWSVEHQKKWIREAECAEQLDARSCCETINGSVWNWTLVGVADQPCSREQNCTKQTAGTLASCSFVIAVPTDPSDVVGTPVGVAVGCAAGIVFLCCSAVVLTFPEVIEGVDWPRLPRLPRGGKWWRCTCKARGLCPDYCGIFRGEGPTQPFAYAQAFGGCVAAGCNTPGESPFNCQCGHVSCRRTS